MCTQASPWRGNLCFDHGFDQRRSAQLLLLVEHREPTCQPPLNFRWMWTRCPLRTRKRRKWRTTKIWFQRRQRLLIKISPSCTAQSCCKCTTRVFFRIPFFTNGCRTVKRIPPSFHVESFPSPSNQCLAKKSTFATRALAVKTNFNKPSSSAVPPRLILVPSFHMLPKITRLWPRMHSNLSSANLSLILT